jgi:hypothetical protein
MNQDLFEQQTLTPSELNANAISDALGKIFSPDNMNSKMGMTLLGNEGELDAELAYLMKDGNPTITMTDGDGEDLADMWVNLRRTEAGILILDPVIAVMPNSESQGIGTGFIKIWIYLLLKSRGNIQILLRHPS